MHTQFLQKMIDGIVNRQTPLYDVVFFYGKQQAVKPVMDSIAETYRKQHPHATVIQTDATRFRQETLQNVLNRNACLPECDLYIFEDIDAVAGMETNEQRLYGILDRLLESGRQIILGGAAPAACIEQLAPRIRAQIEGGISCHVE